VYSDLDNAIENALHDIFEPADSRHPKVIGQEIYYSAVSIGDRYFRIRFKMDALNSTKSLHYKDHKVSEIEIAPALYAGESLKGAANQPAEAISGISLSVLKGDVNPSRAENGILFQSNFEPLLDTALAHPIRGSVSFDQDGGACIRLFEAQNASTVIHEAWHVFLSDMERFEASGTAPAAMLRDLNILRSYVGLGAGEAFTREAHEKIASAGEAYLREGVAPSQELAGVFHNFSIWLAELYRSVREQLGLELTPEVRGVFDRMLVANGQGRTETLDDELIRAKFHEQRDQIHQENVAARAGELDKAQQHDSQNRSTRSEAQGMTL
jgi:hypothetical protein